MKDDNQMIFSYLNTYPLMKSYLVLKLCENLHCFFACVSLLQSYNAENISFCSSLIFFFIKVWVQNRVHHQRTTAVDGQVKLSAPGQCPCKQPAVCCAVKLFDQNSSERQEGGTSAP